MAFIEMFTRAPADEAFDAKEADDLALHVRQEIRRHRTIDGKLTFLVQLVAITIGLHILGVQGAISAIAAFFKVSP